MPTSFTNPYTGATDSTCSVSFGDMASTASVHDTQTEAQFNKAKLKGEWGVIKAKVAKGEVPKGTKILTFTGASGKAGYAYVGPHKTIRMKMFPGSGKPALDFPWSDDSQDAYFKTEGFKFSIPNSTKADKPDDLLEKYTGVGPRVDVSHTWKFWYELNKNKNKFPDGYIAAINDPAGFRLVSGGGKWVAQKLNSDGDWENTNFDASDPSSVTFLAHDGWKTPHPGANDPGPAPASQVAAPTPSPAVAQTSTSVGSMTDEDVATMFVQVKDKLATEKGINIKGSNPDLDKEVFEAIGKQIGYTAAEVKAKVDNYKATGKKLSALKKKTLKKSGDPVTVAPATPVNPHPVSAPNGVPTVASTPIVNTAANNVSATVSSTPTAFYQPEDVAAAFIIAKDKVVADSGGKWTLYSKNDEMDLEIAVQVGLKTGLNPAQQKKAIAEYLSDSSKKLSTLKKSLIKQGKMKAEADTLKKKTTPAATTATINSHAASGYTPPATSSTNAGVPTTPTPAAKKKASDSGDISGINKVQQKDIFDTFKGGYQGKYLTDSPGAIYDNLGAVAAYAQGKGYGELTTLQVMRVIDAYSAEKFGVANGNLFEKKVVEFLVTSAGKKHVEEGKAKALKAAADAKKKAEAQKIKDQMMANQPPLPSDSAMFQNVEQDYVRSWQGRQKPWEIEEKISLRYYTSNAGYTAMNAELRPGGRGSAATKAHCKQARSGMRPIDKPILVHRGTTAISFGLAEFGENDLLYGLVGGLFKQEGFSSTSFGKKAAFGFKPVIIHFECPVGTPAAYVKDISHYQSENEILLDDNIEVRLLRVWEEGGQYHCQVRVEKWDQ